MIGNVVKFKRVDTGKYWIGGKITEGKYGAQIGMKVTPELKAFLDTATIGGWINFSIDKPYEKKTEQPTNHDLEDSVPF